MRISIIAWPKGLQCWAVFTTTSPVTHTAEVAVNAASMAELNSPLAVDTGSQSRTVPVRMRNKKL
jgi:hypothetical protein